MTTEPSAPAGPPAPTRVTRFVLAVAAAVLALAAAVHIGMVFLFVAPQNTIGMAHAKAVDDWVYPEFEQNWKLFAPDPLQSNIDVSARVEIRAAGGGSMVTGWTDLSAQDAAAIRHNPVPSHTEQNELRRAWDMYTSTHDAQNHAMTTTGQLIETYLSRIVVDRLAPSGDGRAILRVQLRSVGTLVPPPSFSGATSDRTQPPTVRELPWWPVTAADFGANAHDRTEAEGR